MVVKTAVLKFQLKKDVNQISLCILSGAQEGIETGLILYGVI